MYCMKQYLFCYICDFFFIRRYCLPAGTRHFTWNSAYCLVLFRKIFLVLLFLFQLILKICKKRKKQRCAGSPLWKFFLIHRKIFQKIPDGIQSDLSSAFNVYTSEVWEDQSSAYREANTPQMTLLVSFIMIIIIMYFLEQFRFVAKLKGKYRDIPCVSCPHKCITPPIINIPHQSFAIIFFFWPLLRHVGS